MSSVLFVVITLAGVGIGLASSGLLLVLRHRGAAARWLAAYTLVLAAGLAEPLLHDLSEPGPGPVSHQLLLAVWGGLSFLYGPLLYLFVRTRTGYAVTGVAQWLHVAPLLAYWVFCGWATINGVHPGRWPMVELLLYESLFIHIFSYCWASGRWFLRGKPQPAPRCSMERTFLQVLLAASILLFAGSFITSHLKAIWPALLPAPAFHLMVQFSLTLLIFLIVLLNTELLDRTAGR